MIPKVMFTPVSLQDNIDVVNLALNNKDSNFDFKIKHISYFQNYQLII